MSTLAAGIFTVHLEPQPAADPTLAPQLSRLTLTKHFHGDLEAESHGEMLACATALSDSAGYVALEVVRGQLQGREGTFALQHSGLMARGQSRLAVTVVPDSGTGQLTGLNGTMLIEVREDIHSYRFEYTLGEPAFL
jgi:hypothetical protein